MVELEKQAKTLFGGTASLVTSPDRRRKRLSARVGSSSIILCTDEENSIIHADDGNNSAPEIGQTQVSRRTKHITAVACAYGCGLIVAIGTHCSKGVR